MEKRTAIVLAGIVIVLALLAVMDTGPGTPADISLPGLEAPGSYLPLPEDTLPFGDRLNSTALLLSAPVGGFTGPQYWVNGPDTLTYEYRFYARGFGPGNVTLTVTEVAYTGSMEPAGPSPGIDTQISPDHFSISPDEVVTAGLNVTIHPEGYSPGSTTRTFWLHADTDLYPNTVADDWIRIRMGDVPDPLFQRSSRVDFGTRDITVRNGEQWAGNLTLALDERETGPARAWFSELDCTTVEMASFDTPQPESAGWPVLSVTPDEFVARSYGTYNLTTVIDTRSHPVRPGTYCYGAHIETAGMGTEFTFKVRVAP